VSARYGKLVQSLSQCDRVDIYWVVTTFPHNVNLMVDNIAPNGYKAHPTTGHEYLEGELAYGYTLSLTSALNGGGRSTPCPERFTPVNDSVPVV
jgi:hypothetical protein